MQKLDPLINLNTFSNFSGDLGPPYRYSAETNPWMPLLNFFRNYQFKCGRNCRLRFRSNVRIQHHPIHAEYNFVAGCWTTMFKEFDNTVGVEWCRDTLFQPFSVFFCFRMYATIWNSFNGLQHRSTKLCPAMSGVMLNLLTPENSWEHCWAALVSDNASLNHKL